MNVHQVNLSSKGTTYFTADHHLWPEELPESLVHFSEELKEGDAWWILGDFFEVWVENHWSVRPGYEDLLTLIKKLTNRGVEVYLLVGNRDFSAGKRLKKATGMKVFNGGMSFEVKGETHLVIHGDELLPDDTSYQKFKGVIRNPVILFLLRCFPMSWLLKLAGETRRQSKSKLENISMTKFEMKPDLIEDICQKLNISKCWAGHLHLKQEKTFILSSKKLEVEVLSESNKEELHALSWSSKQTPSYKSWV